MTNADLDRPPADDGATAPEMLRRVAEEVRAAFPRPLPTPELVLIDIDPRRIHAFWTLSASSVDAARRASPPHGAKAPMVLRVCELSASGTEGGAFDVEVVGLQGRCYIDVWGEPRRYRGKLGLRHADGTLVMLAGPATVELPSLGPDVEYRPAVQGVQALRSKDPNEQAPSGPGEPVRHPFPLPPAEPPGFVADRLAEQAAAEIGNSKSPRAQEPAADAAAVPSAELALPALGMPEQAEPVRHPFPLPPLQAAEIVPEALIGGFLAAGAPGPGDPSPDPGASASHEETRPEPPSADEPHRAEAPAAEPADQRGEAPASLPLENVLTLSSWVLGRETVEFEINAELHIFGRTRSGAQLQLFGRKVMLLPDGSFSITQPLPNGALILSSLLVDRDDQGGER